MGDFFPHQTARCSATKCFAVFDQIKEFRMGISEILRLAKNKNAKKHKGKEDRQSVGQHFSKYRQTNRKYNNMTNNMWNLMVSVQSLAKLSVGCLRVLY